jgi:hypothetical protein
LGKRKTLSLKENPLAQYLFGSAEKVEAENYQSIAEAWYSLQ